MKFIACLASACALTCVAFGATAPSAELRPDPARVTQYQQTIGYPATPHSMSVTVVGAPGTHFETFIRRPGGGPLEPFGAGSWIPGGGIITIAMSGGPPQPPVTRVEFWTVSSAPVTAQMQIW